MSGRFVRQSKYRNVFAQAAKADQAFTGTKLSTTGWDTNFLCANTKYFGIMWQAGGGGVFGVAPLNKPGKLGGLPLVCVHKAAVLDIEFHPFHEDLIASCSEDCKIAITKIPEGGVTAPIDTPVQVLNGHKRKVGTINFHPCAENVLASSASDFTVKLWDIEKGDELFSTGGHTDIITSCSFNKNGSQIATVCKDKKLRIIDPRAQQIVNETICHQGVKGVRVCQLTDKDKIATTGFTRNVERELCFWDPRALEKPIARSTIDNSSGVLMPFYDPDCGLLYLGGKGDGNIRYYEIVDDAPFFYYINEFKSSAPQRGLAMLPKRACNVSACEVASFLKAEVTKVEPVSFIVPRKSDLFQEDIYPDAYAGIPSLTAAEWASGKDADPDCSFSMAPGFVPPVRAADFNPVVKEVKEEKPKTEKELKEEIVALEKKVAYLEAELAKRDALIKELQAKPVEIVEEIIEEVIEE